MKKFIKELVDASFNSACIIILFLGASYAMDRIDLLENVKHTKPKLVPTPCEFEQDIVDKQICFVKNTK